MYLLVGNGSQNKKEIAMTKEEKAYYINAILEELCQQNTLRELSKKEKQFDIGDTFFRLAFMNDNKLLKMAQAMKISPPKT